MICRGQARDLGHPRGRVVTQIGLVHDAVVIDDKSHDPGIGVLGRPGDDRGITKQLVAKQIVDGPAIGRWSAPLCRSKILTWTVF